MAVTRLPICNQVSLQTHTYMYMAVYVWWVGRVSLAWLLLTGWVECSRGWLLVVVMSVLGIVVVVVGGTKVGMIEVCCVCFCLR